MGSARSRFRNGRHHRTPSRTSRTTPEAGQFHMPACLCNIFLSAFAMPSLACLCLDSNYGTPGQLRLSPSLPTPYERGECPSWLLPCICPHGISGTPCPFLRVARAHSTIPVAWTHGLLLPTSPFPGCPLLSTHLSTAMLPAGQWTPAPFKKVLCLLSTPTTKRYPIG